MISCVEKGDVLGWTPDKGGYFIILGRYILTEWGLNIKLSDHVIEVDDGPLKGSTEPMVDMGTFKLKTNRSR